MKYFALLILLANVLALHGQVINTAIMDTTDYKRNGKLTIEGYIDSYYAYNFNKPHNKEQPYLYSMARHNEVNINLAFVDLKYSSSRVRGRIAPGFGTYMNANYSNEPGTLKNFVEANGGYRISKSKNVWIDVGILGSPYTNESAISKDQLTYTRSLSAENVPYYLSGVKLSAPLSKKLNGYVYLINGWQQITDQNANKSLGTQLEWRPSNSLLINWNTYVGNEQSTIDSVKGLRTFTDFYFIFNKNRWSMTGCAYVGRQKSTLQDRVWWQANLIGKYAFTPQVSTTARAEYFQDDSGVIVMPVTNSQGFRTFGTSFGINVAADTNLLFRTELRYLFSNSEIYQRNNTPSNNSLIFTASVCLWF